MSKENVDVIRSIYEASAKGDVPKVLEGMDPQVEWHEAESFPYADGNPYIGPQAVVEGVFKRVNRDWEDWSMVISEYLDAGNTVVVLGRYKGKYRKTGAPLDAQFAHVWWLRNGKAARFQQYTDTERVAKAVRGPE